MEKLMSEPVDANNGNPSPMAATEASAPPPAPTAPPKLYDQERNRRYGVTTLAEIQGEYGGNQDALAARIRQDRTRRHKKTWEDVVERASEGVRMRVLETSLTGTGRATELMIKQTGYQAPTTQLRIQLGEFFPWAAPRLQRDMERALVEVKQAPGSLITRCPASG
jgi:hypothetical protein